MSSQQPNSFFSCTKTCHDCCLLLATRCHHKPLAKLQHPDTPHLETDTPWLRDGNGNSGKPSNTMVNKKVVPFKNVAGRQQGDNLFNHHCMSLCEDKILTNNSIQGKALKSDIGGKPFLEYKKHSVNNRMYENRDFCP